MSRIEEVIGPQPPAWQPQPYRPRDNACVCCRQMLRLADLVFCARCEGHPLGEWCAPMKAQPLRFWDSDRKRWRDREEVVAKQATPQAALF